MDYINWFLNVEPVLNTWDKSYLVMVYNSFYILLIWSANILGSFVLFCFVFRAVPAAYGNSQASGWIGATTAGLHQSRSNIWPVSSTYAAALSSAGSLTHWARPGIEPSSSSILVKFFFFNLFFTVISPNTLVKFLTYWATTGTPYSGFVHLCSWEILICGFLFL